MSEVVWYCPICQSEGYDPSVDFCDSDGARVRPIAERGAQWIGKVLDEKYRVLRFVDAGATAEVFEAERIGTGKRVAIKLLHAAFADASGARDRFLQEARLVSLIAHPNVVEIFDFGTLPESVHYMAMELLSGRSLAAELLVKPMAPLTALKFAMQACEGFAAAHERDVIHCDIKPANLFLQGPPGSDDVTLKILDLGIGRLYARSADPSSVDGGIIAGTPDYMSPEQATAGPLGPATDIYAMGIMLYEMLLGVLPFEDVSYREVLAKQVNETPRWRMDLAQARGVPPEAAAVVLRAMEKDPARRQASMMDLQRDLAALASVTRARTSLGTKPTMAMEAPPKTSRGSSPGAASASVSSRTANGVGTSSSRSSPSDDRTRPAAERLSMPYRSEKPSRPGTRPTTGPQARPTTGQHSRPATGPHARAGGPVQVVPLAGATGADNEVVEIAPDVYWVGRRKGAALECNSYLRVFRNGTTEVSVLIDPGPPRDFEVISAKVGAVIGSIRRLDFVFLNHQDPDVSSNAAAIQQASPRARVMCSEDTWRLVHMSGLDARRYAPVERFPGGVAKLATGHEIVFVPTPFCHFRGATMLYDPTSRVLFSGDLLGGAHAQHFVASGGRWWSGVEIFHQVYMPSSRALALAASRIRRLEPTPKIIAPQHGSLIIGDAVQPAVDAIASMPVGLDVPDAAPGSERFVTAANEIVREYSELAGADRARQLLEGYGDEGAFTSLFHRSGDKIEGFKVAPYLAVEALCNDALANLSAEHRGDLQRTIRAIWKEHGLDAAPASQTSS